jgi:mycothiol synthase
MHLSDNFLIRPMGPDDLATSIELWMTTSAYDIRRRLGDRLAAEELEDDRFVLVAELDGTVVGAAKLTTERAFPGTASALVAVHEAERGKGIGTALAGMLAGRFESFGGISAVTCAIRDDLDRGREFAERYGFVKTGHSLGLRLDLPGPVMALAGQADRAADAARVRTRTTRPDAEREEVMDCIVRCFAGLPIPFGDGQGYDPHADTGLLPDDAIVVLAEPLDEPGRPCGVTVAVPEPDSGAWHIGFTGVDPGHRRRGVAAAVKTASLVAVHEVGARAVTTLNDESNHVLSLNRKLGMRQVAGQAGYWGMTRLLDR